MRRTDALTSAAGVSTACWRVKRRRERQGKEETLSERDRFFVLFLFFSKKMVSLQWPCLFLSLFRAFGFLLAVFRSGGTVRHTVFSRSYLGESHRRRSAGRRRRRAERRRERRGLAQRRRRKRVAEVVGRAGEPDPGVLPAWRRGRCGEERVELGRVDGDLSFLLKKRERRERERGMSERKKK